MTAVVSTRCQKCGAELRDSVSRLFGVGPECRKGMTTADLRAAMDQNTPGHVPTAPARPASVQARRHRAELQRVTAPVVTSKRCPHEDQPATCALCRRDNDPKRVSERVIALVQRMPMAERLAAEKVAARKLWRAYLPIQLTIGSE